MRLSLLHHGWISVLLSSGHSLQSSTEQSPIEKRGLDRRSFGTVVSSTIASSAIVDRPLDASAASPLKAEETDSFLTRVERKMRRPPVKMLRPEIDLDFAVLLMRSSYNALDELDCVPMEQYQRDLFLFRQSEYDDYRTQLGPGVIYQGPNRKNPSIMCPCISDAYYFDFLSFAQYATISREIAENPPMIFQERVDTNDDDDDDDGNNNDKSGTVDDLTNRREKVRVVRRTIPDDQLVVLHDKLVGQAIIDRFEELVGSFSESTTATMELVTGLVRYFVIQGYAREGMVNSLSVADGSYEITLEASAIWWSGQALQLRRTALNNCFLSKALAELGRRRSDPFLSTVSTKILYDNGGKQRIRFQIGTDSNSNLDPKRIE